MGYTIKELSLKSPYYISKERRLELEHFCKQYPEWKKLYNSQTLLMTGSGSEVKKTDISDPTADVAIKLAKYSHFMDIFNTSLRQVLVANGYEDNTEFNIALFNVLRNNIICGRSYDKSDLPMYISEYEYRNMKRHFFYILDKVRD